MTDVWHKFYQEKAPCDSCGHAVVCDLARIACRAFSGFVNTGQFNPDTPRVPTRLIYTKIFFEGEE